MNKFFEPVTDIIKNVSKKKRRNITETSFEKNKAIETLNDTLLEIMSDRGILASYFFSSLLYRNILILNILVNSNG